jgi:hypothetical protein
MEIRNPRLGFLVVEVVVFRCTCASFFLSLSLYMYVALVFFHSYHQPELVRAIYGELNQAGLARGALSYQQLLPFDQHHYEGLADIDAVFGGVQAATAAAAAAAAVATAGEGEGSCSPCAYIERTCAHIEGQWHVCELC